MRACIKALTKGMEKTYEVFKRENWQNLMAMWDGEQSKEDEKLKKTSSKM